MNQRMLFQLNADQLALQHQYDQLSSGRSVLKISDNPAAANRALGLNRGIDHGNQMVRNANSTIGYYDTADRSLASVDNALITARATAVQGVETINSQDERDAMALTIRETINNVFAAGNAMFRDQQLLGGILNDGNAYNFVDGDIVYSGRDAIGQTMLGSGELSALNATAAESLGTNNVFLKGEPLGAALDYNTRLVDMRGGIGVAPGVIELSGGEGSVQVDLSNAATIGDVADVLSKVQLDGRPLSVTIGDDSLKIAYADDLPGTLAIQDTKGSTLARDLSILNPGGLTAPPIIGDRLTPRLTTNTKIEDLAFGAGIDLSGGITIKQGNQSFAIDFSEAKTMGDVLIAINRSGADVHAELNDTDGSIQLRALRSGVDYSVGENGQSAAQELGIRSATENTTLKELGRGRGVVLNPNSEDLVITRPDGVVLSLDLEGAETIDDVIQLIRNHPNNQDTSRILVGLNTIGNGIELQAPPGAEPMSIRQPQWSNAGTRLGLIPEGQSEAFGETVGSVNQIAGEDYMPRDAGGALDTLLRLETAIRDGDIPEIERLQARVDADLDRASRTRGRIGVWTRNLQDLKDASETTVIQLKDQLSNEVDADLATLISELSQRQLSIDASMRIIGQASQTTVLNYL
ncbi:flagellar hook-associated protein FlgL [Novipirellula galeiformis]|uniref:Flagellar hook-associated protein FlgL n=2 Tax=Novipirellula galeiformis TaxID=2528004 RepID=A0A5C6CKJ2_9BACT|nr:flagellar hook-associated protein FlgL [Novipirellula galeiformis]